MNKIYVAKIGKTVGLKGQQKLHIDSDFPEQFKKDTKLITNKKKELIIESYNQASDTVKFIGINSVEEAKKLINQELYASVEDTKQNCDLDKNQYFWFDILGCDIVEDNLILGIVDDVQRMPLSDYIQVKTTKELVDKNYSNTFLLPYIMDEYIINVDIDKKIINVRDAKEILEAS